MNFASSAFGQFMASSAGRAARVIAGIVLIALGIWLSGGWGIALIVVGLVPLLAGLFDVCVFSALFGGPFSGQRIRALRKG
jgi:fatty acid desaturase